MLNEICQDYSKCRVFKKLNGYPIRHTNIKFKKSEMSQPDILLKLFSQINQITQINTKKNTDYVIHLIQFSVFQL